MEIARRIVLFECGMGALWVALGAMQSGPAGLRAGWWVAAAALVGTVALVYGEEHRRPVRDGFYRAALAVALVIGAVVACATVVLVTDLAVLTVVSAAMVGMGLGLLGYRVIYGVVRPLPETRLDAARDRAV